MTATETLRFASILVTEDDNDTRELLSVVLKRSGYVVACLEDGDKAISFLKLVKPDVIVTDLTMPNVDGIELIKFVRSSPVLSDTPIVAISGYKNGSLRAAEEAGANATMVKPLDFDQLLSTIDHILDPS